ncbi:IS3 family transposase [Cloacibacillus porcorum]|nr:IS3 family transposase [Cloacibacillus porcorum]
MEQEIEEYIELFNEERPVYALGCMTSNQYKEAYMGKYSQKITTTPY